MGMASFSDDQAPVRKEFQSLKKLFDKHAQQNPVATESLLQDPTPNLKLQILSMGMSGDYQIALEEGSNMIRVGSLLFGARTKSEI
jgi:PLP dependent protein